MYVKEQFAEGRSEVRAKHKLLVWCRFNEINYFLFTQLENN